MEDLYDITLTSEDKNKNIHFFAARGMDEELMKEIKDKKNIDVENFMGWTPLMMAAKNGNMDTVEILLDNGANITKKNKYSMSVFLISITSGNVSLVELVLERLLKSGISKRSMEEVISPLSLAVLFRRIPVLNFLLKKKFDVNCPTVETNVTPLMIAAALSNMKAINILISKNADVHLKNFMGSTFNDIRNLKENGFSYKLKYLNQAEKSPQIGTNNTPAYCTFSPSVDQLYFLNMLNNSNISPMTPVTPTIISPLPMSFPYYFNM